MKFSKKLLEGRLVKRYKRFFADVEYVNEKSKLEQVTIHVPNTGSLRGVITASSDQQKCWFSLHGDEAKKLKGTLEAIQTIDGAWVGVNTSNPNKIVTEAIKNSLALDKGFLPHWKGFHFYKPEFKINEKSRLDGALLVSEADLENSKSKKHFIEIKNTTYKKIIGTKSVAQFPDSVTERGQKHLLEMMKLMKQGHTCEVIFTVQRSDVDFFSAADELDPEYAKLLKQAEEQGLIVSPLKVELSQSEIFLTPQILKRIK